MTVSVSNMAQVDLHHIFEGVLALLLNIFSSSKDYKFSSHFCQRFLLAVFNFLPVTLQ